MEILAAADDVFRKMEQYLVQIDRDLYARSLDVYSGSSLGGHTRHIVEFFTCLLDQCESGKVNYDTRKREKEIEENPIFAQEKIEEIRRKMPALPLHSTVFLGYCYNENNEVSFVETTVYRELVHTIDHAVHHMALIKIGLRLYAPDIVISPDFGVARATCNYLQYKRVY